jgi:hypothetical protein
VSMQVAATQSGSLQVGNEAGNQALNSTLSLRTLPYELAQDI